MVNAKCLLGGNGSGQCIIISIKKTTMYNYHHRSCNIQPACTTLIARDISLTLISTTSAMRVLERPSDNM